jgi:D-arabinose 1-dehydrogenase-like Zn-dependent alcohol dehydrogenase
VGKKSTYRAVQAVSPGKLELTEKPVLDPSAGHVRIRVEACGVRHSDSATVEGVLPIEWPRVPGHEAVGRIDAIGEGVAGWKLDQRVGVGFLGGNCGYCDYCRDGDLVNCTNQGYTGVQHDGGYAEMMIAKASGLIAVPDDLSSVDAAPPLCAGLTTFSALRNAPARAGDLVAVFGVSGLRPRISVPVSRFVCRVHSQVCRRIGLRSDTACARGVAPTIKACISAVVASLWDRRSTNRSIPVRSAQRMRGSW